MKKDSSVIINNKSDNNLTLQKKKKHDNSKILLQCTYVPIYIYIITVYNTSIIFINNIVGDSLETFKTNVMILSDDNDSGVLKNYNKKKRRLHKVD